MIALFASHKDYVGLLAIVGLLSGLYALAFCAITGTRKPIPGEDYDERGTYECDGDCLNGGKCINKNRKVA